MTRASVFIALAAAFSAANAFPLEKRIAQTISASTTKWVDACNAAGGGQQCGAISQTAFMTLLAAAGPCDQQNAADQMVDLAKQLNNNADMIKFAQIFTQQPRNTPESTQVLYCQQAPANSELNGLFQCQFEGTKDTFTGGVQAGAAGTVPFGLTSLAVPRSCPANPTGGVSDGAQLTDSTDDPGLNNIATIGSGSGSGAGSGAGSNGGGGSAASSTAQAGGSATATTPASEESGATGSDSCQSAVTEIVTVTATVTAGASGGGATGSASASTPATTGASSGGSSSGGSSSFVLSNGQAAQQLNAQFATLTADSPCQDGENACVGSSFAMCVGGKFSLTDCGAANGVTCAALPLVNKAGTSITCTTEAEAVQRITNTGATGGLTGSG